MKQLLFLLLFPCLAMAQYPGNGNQKITLGEQSTADGLVYRGVANDTNVITPFSDTSAYIILDTVNSKFYHYNRTTTYWSLAVGGVTSFSAGTTGLTPTGETTGAVTLGGTLAVANGGTGTGTAFTAGSVVYAGASGTYTQDNSALFYNDTNGKLGIGTTDPTEKLHVVGNGLFTGNVIIKGASENLIIIDGTTYSGFRLHRNGDPKFAFFNNNAGTDFFDIYNYTEGASALVISSDNETWLGYTSDQGAYKLQINGTPQATGALVVTSDEKFKENITPLNKGLEIVNKLKPVTYNFITDTKNNFSVNEEVGFIAQDVDRALSTETFAKSIVNSADDSEPTSTMGLATQNLIPILVKAIQEQQALIKALEQRLLILENK